MAEKDKTDSMDEKIKDLETKVRTMSTCIEVAAIITSTLDHNKVMSLVMEKSREVMNAEACSILLYNKNTNKLEFRLALNEDTEKAKVLQDKVGLDMGQGIAGWVAQNLKPVLVEDAQKDPRFHNSMDEITSFVTKSLIAVPMVGRSGLVGVAEIMNPKHKEHFDEFDLDVFQTHARQVAIAIENARFHKLALKRERLKQELEIAASLQRSFLPESPVLKKNKIRVSAASVAASNIGGDFYDFADFPGDNVGVVVGDISGKGISGALYMAKVISDFRHVVHTAMSTKEAFEHLNSVLSRMPRGMFLTASYIIADTLTGKLHISVAGHPPAVWLTSEGIKVLDASAGPPLGIMPAEYPSSTVSMNDGDRLIFVTDGVFEARNNKGKILGYKRMVEFLKAHAEEPDILNSLLEHVKGFHGGARMADDLTIVEISFGERK
jgi:sigma-B regulation protein RsbU (phosphoserine phosphatase)